jgi:transposase-like protein
MDKKPNTLQEAVIYFSDFEHCKAFMVSLRWPDGVVRCPHCGAEKLSWLAAPRLWKCYGKHEKAKFSLKTGTIFEDSAVPLDKWLIAVWLIVNCKNGISSYEVARDLGVSQKSAWHMMHRIRFALHSGSFLAGGEVEVDETFIGGKARNMHASKRRVRITSSGGSKDKVAVMGFLERGGRVQAKVLNPVWKKHAIHAEVREHVAPGSVLYTDAYRSYNGLEADYQRYVIDHAISYVEGHVHTNGIENYWSQLKRGLKGTYVSVEPFHLFRYLDEQAFRFNHRKDMKDFDRFQLALSKVVGKRLTWNMLTGKSADERPPVLN